MNVASSPPRSAHFFSSSAATTAAVLRIRMRSAASLAALSRFKDRRMFSAASTYAADGVDPSLPSGVDPNRIGVEGLGLGFTFLAPGVLLGVFLSTCLTGVARGGARRRGSGVTDLRGGVRARASTLLAPASSAGDDPWSSTRLLLYPLGRHDGVYGDPRHGADDLASAADMYRGSTAE